MINSEQIFKLLVTFTLIKDTYNYITLSKAC